jgi:predicted ribosomally synthesized peptide with nif11-like leader
MSLDQLDAFLAYARTAAGDDGDALRAALAAPLDLDAFLALARCHGYSLVETDVLAAQAREDSRRSDADLQRQAGEEARRLRSFIPG